MAPRGPQEGPRTQHGLETAPRWPKRWPRAASGYFCTRTRMCLRMCSRVRICTHHVHVSASPMSMVVTPCCYCYSSYSSYSCYLLRLLLLLRLPLLLLLLLLHLLHLLICLLLMACCAIKSHEMCNLSINVHVCAIRSYISMCLTIQIALRTQYAFILTIKLALTIPSSIKMGIRACIQHSSNHFQKHVWSIIFENAVSIGCIQIRDDNDRLPELQRTLPAPEVRRGQIPMKRLIQERPLDG